MVLSLTLRTRGEELHHQNLCCTPGCFLNTPEKAPDRQKQVKISFFSLSRRLKLINSVNTSGRERDAS